MNKPRILIADDHPMLRDGLKAILSGRFDIVGEADNGFEALRLIADKKPDVVIMDITMPELNGITATKRISADFPGVKVIMLSMHSDAYHAIDSFRAGARGYVLKGSAPQELLSAVERVLAGAKYASPSIAEELLNDFVEIIKKDQSFDPFDSLSEREREVLRLVADGATSKEIAAKLYISVSTVKSHRNNLMKKLKVNDVAGLIKIAIRKGLVVPE